MTTPATPDEHLRVRALEALGPLGEPLAREALEQGIVGVEHDVKVWEGTQGTMHGHRIVVSVDAELQVRLASSHAAIDGLSAALATAMSERSGHAVADVRIAIRSEATERPSGSSGPYRGRS